VSRPRDLPPPARFPHGTRSRYVSGCRCSECRAANTAAYHERQRRAKALAAEILAPVATVEQAWTGPDGTKRTRTYRRACPGVLKKPCPTRSHLRTDSKGGVCSGCRERLVWNGLVDAAPARRHLLKLSRKGVGYKSVAAACDVAKTTLARVLAGTKTRLRADTVRRILGVTPDAVADHALVPADRVWLLISRLREEGFSKAELARRLAYQSPALQLRKGKVLARTAQRIERFYRAVMT
jgi:hypothetical protein